MDEEIQFERPRAWAEQLAEWRDRPNLLNDGSAFELLASLSLFTDDDVPRCLDELGASDAWLIAESMRGLPDDASYSFMSVGTNSGLTLVAWRIEPRVLRIAREWLRGRGEDVGPPPTHARVRVLGVTPGVRDRVSLDVEILEGEVGRGMSLAGDGATVFGARIRYLPLSERARGHRLVSGRLMKSSKLPAIASVLVGAPPRRAGDDPP